ncbi:MAG: 50S ribosomal protein L19 [Candidatus Levybacteria bacterium RIFCSPLOWO2_01_FULL_39_24]|nr:MAG: 50S ribosomal protein L19 [Candidatus Levybacteria bacterium RIFCSPHIGHO2_01_FULL_40_16]OGH28679.1 MAG: 50S ribosomal protein L19 [Candidatus Levybacteria bacterium RIFCSPHIGHO2_12_FULL_39_9]OGH46442.1 MAG: 50S ribosomal protein L19 [Candidatus Levybacteria bacterium RIFCSPLOWO2_01_FULL_39_24]
MSFMIKDVDFVPGDIIRVHERIKEGDKSRIQIFEGTVLAFKGRGENQSFTVMKIVGGISVEKIFPVKSPNIEKVEVKEHSKKKIRRAKLYYLRLPKPA